VNDAPGPLSDVRVIDLAGESAVFAGRLLGELGADVVRVEPPGGDSVRRRPPFLDDEPGPERSLYHLHFNASKRSVALDIRRPEGAELLRRLARASDVVLETGRPGEMDALGVGYEALRPVNPVLIYATVTPFGQEGPMRDYRGNDLTAVASSGLMWLNGFPEDPPNQPGAEQAYHMASLALTASIATAIVARGRSADGAGHRIDVSLQEAMSMATLQHASPNVYAWYRRVPARQGIRLLRGRNLFQCADGLWVSVVVSPYRWAEFLEWCRDEGIGEHLFDEQWRDPAYRIEHASEVSEVTAQLAARHPREHIFHEGQRRRLMVTPSNTVRDLVDDAQLRAREYFVEYEHPATGRTLKDTGVAYQFSRTPAGVRRPAPRFGEHTEEVLCGLLGLDEAAVERLRASGVVG
jgi:crotonobetainyl-CoA:carnitine CoA-transferase CaiB-like acyl-CoA transferase